MGGHRHPSAVVIVTTKGPMAAMHIGSEKQQ